MMTLIQTKGFVRMRVYNDRPLFNTLTILLLLSFTILPITTFARTPIGHVKHPNAWFVGLGGGASWISLPSSTSVINGAIVPPPFNQDTYTINNPSTGIAQLDAGYVWYIPRMYFPFYSAYIQYRHYFANNISGSIDQYSLPIFENYHYTMRYEADLFTINGKLGLFQLNQLLPYLSGGMGFIINHLNSYSESPTPNVTPRNSPAYQGNSNTQLALTLGAGLDFIINQCTTVTLGYDHVFQDNIKSGPGVATWSSTTLNFGNTKMDTLFINVTTHFPQA